MPNISTSSHLMEQIVFDLENKLINKINDKNIVNHLLLIVGSMISYYGDTYKDHIYEVILNTNYIIDDYSNFKLTYAMRDILNKNINEYQNNHVISICNIEKNIDKNDIKAYKASYSLCINKNIYPIDLYECLIREVNKIFLSINKTFNIIENKITLRNGIANTNLSDSNNQETRKTINDIITYLQIEDILKVCKRLEYSGTNKDLNKLLNNIKDYNTDNVIMDYCLPLVNLFRPLFNLDFVKKLLNENMFIGNIDNICNEFDSILGNGSFDKMSKKLDKLYNDFYNGTLGYNISEYNISKEYISIRDNFVNKYIKKKYA